MRGLVVKMAKDAERVMEKTCYNCGSPISKETCEEFPEVCEHWSPKKPIINADRVHAMTDEELADLLCDHACMLCPLPDKCDGRMEIGRTACYERWLDWLKQEVTDV